jgi:subtilisin family serine protease
MRMRMLWCGLTTAAVAFTCSPVAFGSRLVSVGYRSPAALHGLRVVRRLDALGTAEVRVAGRQAEVALRAQPGIRFVQPLVAREAAGGPVPAGPTVALPLEWQWAAMHADLVPPSALQAAAGITIAIVDTGADLSAPAIADKRPVTYSVVAGSPLVQDTVGHGTFVASLAAGLGGEAQLMIVQANRRGGGFSDVDEATAIVWAVDHGAKIINLSLGGTRTSIVECHAIDYAVAHDVLLVASAGNSAQQGNPVVYPAALIGRRGLVVGAARANGARAPFSTTGSYVDVLAPGVNVLGALAGGVLPGGLFSPVATPGWTGAYGLGSGTSYAAPEVAGAAALVWAANPLLSPVGVAAVLEGSASGRGTWTSDLAFGNVDVANAVAHAADPPLPQVLLPPGPVRATP